MTFSRCLLAALGLVTACLLTACNGLGGPRQIVLTPADLLRAMAPRFPVERRLLGVLEVRADLPRLRLIPETQRLGAEFDVTIDDRLSRQTYRGVIGLESALRYERSDQSVRLDRLRVQRLQFDGLPAAAQPLIQTAGSALAEQMLADMTVYRFPAEKVRAAERYGYAPNAISVGAAGVTVELVPISGPAGSPLAPLR